MSHVDDSRESVDSRVDTEQGSEGETGRSVSNLVRAVRRRASPGAVAGAGGGVLLVRGLKTLRDGDVRSGITQSVVGGALVALAVGERRSAAEGSGSSTAEEADVDQRDVVDTAPDLEGVTEESESGSESESVDHSDGDDASAVVDTAPDVEDAATDPEERTSEHASGDEAASVVDTSPDVENATSGGGTDDESAEEDDSGWTEVESMDDDGSETDDADDGADDGGGQTNESESERTADDADESEDGEAETVDGSDTSTEDSVEEESADEESAGEESADEESVDEEGEMEERAAEESESYDRLGGAAFDEESNSLPAPQRAFNREYLALGAEAVWGIREADDAVLVSQLYDSIEDRDGVQYVASTQIDDERSVTVPDAILDHWDVVAGGGVAVESGDDLVFATSDELKGDDLLIVVPAEWADDVLGDE